MKVYEEVVQIGELRQKSILMLNEVKSILDNWGVNYWLDFGTLLGFVRDGKSMPWDGDYDLSTLDVDLEKKKGLWNELISRGYNVEIKYANIKITKKDWKIGHYRIDLHRLRINLKNDVEYAYGGIYKNKINQYFDSISKIISLITIPTDESKIKYPTYGILCRALLEINVDPHKLENSSPFKVIKGKYNDHYDFTIIYKNKKYDFSVIKRSNSRSYKFFYTVLKFNFSFINKLIKFIIINYLSIIGISPTYRVFFPKEYYDNFKIIKFYDNEYKIPINSEKHLERIYGQDWQTPKVTRSKIFFKKISYN